MQLIPGGLIRASGRKFYIYYMWEDIILDYRTFKAENFEFIDETNWWTKANYYIGNMIRPRDSAGPTPVQFKRTSKQRRRNVYLEDLCDAIGLDDPSLQKIITFHKHRLRLRSIVSFVLYLLIALPVSQIVVLGLIWLTSITRPLQKKLVIENNPLLTSLLNFALFILLLLFTYIFMFVVIRTAFRFTSALTTKNFAETLCAQTIIYLILELTRDDVLRNPHKRRSLVARINDLAQNTLLLSSRFRSKNEANQDWLREHFKRMESYIRERERWALAPIEVTLNDLRRDFYHLVDIYITGNYGEFSWEKIEHTPTPPPLTFMQRVFKSLPRFLGILLPLFFMGFFLWQSTRLGNMGIDTNVVALILIAWLLLAIDASLKLGIVAGVVNLAKEIKNLK